MRKIINLLDSRCLLGAGVISVELTEVPEGKNKGRKTHQTPFVRMKVYVFDNKECAEEEYTCLDNGLEKEQVHLLFI